MLQFEIGAVIFLVWGQSHCNMCHFTVWMRRCNMACKLWEVLHCISGHVPWIVVRWINRDEFYQEAVNEQKGNRCQSYLLMVYDSVNTKHDEPFIICQSPESWLKLTSWGEQKCWLTLCVCSIFDSKSSTTFRLRVPGCHWVQVTSGQGTYKWGEPGSYISSSSWVSKGCPCAVFMPQSGLNSLANEGEHQSQPGPSRRISFNTPAMKSILLMSWWQLEMPTRKP